mgnify:CR=1 FL=1
MAIRMGKRVGWAFLAVVLVSSLDAWRKARRLRLRRGRAGQGASAEDLGCVEHARSGECGAVLRVRAARVFRSRAVEVWELGGVSEGRGRCASRFQDREVDRE